MGRYDRLKIYNDLGNFVNPNRLYIQGPNYNRAENLIDFGLADSDNTTTLKVYTEDRNWERVTLNKHVEIIPGSKYTTGSFKLIPASGFCSCTKTSSNNYRKATWYFRTKVKRVAFSTNTNIFRCGNSSSTSEVKIIWNSDGKFYFKRSYGSGGTNTYTTPDAFNSLDTIYQIDFTIENGTNKLKIKIINTSTLEENNYEVSLTAGSNFTITNATNTVGSNEVQFYDYIQAQGVKYQWSTYTRDIDLDTATSGASGDYTDLNIVTEPDTEIVTWE